MTRSLIRSLRRFPLVGRLILFMRRLRGHAGIRRVLVDASAVQTHYRLPEGDILEISEARVSAQPIAVVGPDNVYIWAGAPQLKRSPYTADVLWKTLPPARRLPGRTLFAAVDGFSYYHWLTGVLPKLLMSQKAGVDFAALSQIIVNPRHKGRINFQTETLALLGIELNKILFIDRGIHLACESLILPPEPTRSEQTDLQPWALELLRQHLLPLARPPVRPAERLFIRRATARRRRLIDEDSIEKSLEVLGFVGVTLEALPWTEQVGLFRQVRSVVALHGAGLSNLLFSQPNTRLVEILPDAWRNPCFERLSAHIGARYSCVCAAPVGARKGFAADARVNSAALLKAVAAALA